MYCTKCGYKNDDQSRFCASCGAPQDTMSGGELAHKQDMENVVILKPGVWSSYRNGFTKMFKNFFELFLIGVIAFFSVQNMQ